MESLFCEFLVKKKPWICNIALNLKTNKKNKKSYTVFKRPKVNIIYFFFFGKGQTEMRSF